MDRCHLESGDRLYQGVAGVRPHCYAERFAERWRGVPGHSYGQGFDLRLWESRLDQPAQWRKPRMIFVNSMGDLFHKDIPGGFIDRVFAQMEAVDCHIY
ncbi:Phage protein [Candidatus Synechococcus spongiarum]|uniref:Phage protein n=1 Tax=Candidatus Synechococcus spongiarum TaxID=431041 RepID=A0A170TDV7_9SYNE|nr:Phage protein [Candidatus Synechococcus spongiarum]